jgi:hypothetical protein
MSALLAYRAEWRRLDTGRGGRVALLQQAGVLLDRGRNFALGRSRLRSTPSSAEQLASDI